MDAALTEVQVEVVVDYKGTTSEGVATQGANAEGAPDTAGEEGDEVNVAPEDEANLPYFVPSFFSFSFSFSLARTICAL